MTAASFFRRLIIAALAFTLALIYIFINFKGISTADGMEKAQLAREVARGEYRSKVIRPLTLWQYGQKHDEDAYLEAVVNMDSYNSPLYPVILGAVFKVIGADDFESWKMKKAETVYSLDRVIVGVSVFFFLMGLLITYALARKMFDGTVAGMTFLILLTCEMFWNFTQTGMPNCLMFMIFMGALYFTYLATEKSSEENGNGIIPGAFAGVLLVLLCMCHWMGVWLLLGFILYSFFFLRPMGIIAAITIVIALLAFAFPVIKNLEQTGNPFGTAFYSLYAGLGVSNDLIMRSGDAGEFFIPFRDVALKFLRNLLGQVTHVYEYMGLIIVAPLFFLSLMHTYKRKPVASFRWGVLIMWFFVSLGMSVYGLGEDAYHSMQMHYLFAGAMSIYGLSMIMITWNRLPIVRELEGVLKESHLIILGVIACAPLLLTIPDGVFRGFTFKANYPNWPPYYPSALNVKLHPIIEEERYIFSDQPWAVAWYADRYAIWTPHNLKTFKKIESLASAQSTPMVGVHVSPSSFGEGPFYKSFENNRDLAAIALDGWATLVTKGGLKLGGLAEQSKDASQVMSKYPYALPLNGPLMLFYAAEKPSLSQLEK